MKNSSFLKGRRMRVFAGPNGSGKSTIFDQMDRVAKRVNLGGHSVENEKIENRYKRALTLLKPAVQKAYRSFLWDNSSSEAKLNNGN